MTAVAPQPSQMSEALQRFLQQEDEDAVSTDNGGVVTGELDSSTLDITSTSVSLEGLVGEVERLGEHEVLRAILDQGSDVREFGRQYETQLRGAELDSIQDYILESDNLSLLHRQIEECDSILGAMETMLGKFQADLGNVSGEIRSLQEQSQSMSIKLQNRKAAEAKLGSFVESLSLPPALVQAIVQGDVDEGFREHLIQLHRKLEFAERSDMARESAALRDVAPELDRLRIKALFKAREFLIARIYNLRKPKTNIQILQQNVLLKHRHLMQFMRRHGRDVAAEVRAAYIETLSRVLSGHFKAYLTALDPLLDQTVTAADLVGEPAPQGGMSAIGNLFTRGPGAEQRRNDAFALGERGALLHHLDQPAVIPHVAQSEGRRLPLEAVFRSVNRLLLDTATSEWLFCSDFFAEDGVFLDLFAPTQQMVEAGLAAQLQECHDMLAVLLMVRINYHHRVMMAKRRIPALDGYMDRINLLLWPRFKALFDAQLGSIKALQAMWGGEYDKRPHVLATRYAALAASLLLLNANYQDAQMAHNLERLRHAAVDALVRTANAAPNKRLGNIFLIINFTHICQAIREASAKAAQNPLPGEAEVNAQEASGGPLGQEGQDTQKEFDDHLANWVSKYVEDSLARHFGSLVDFLKRADSAARKLRSQGAGLDAVVPGYGPTEAAPVVHDFSAKWKASMEALNKENGKDFKGNSCGWEVLKATMTQLLLLYTRLLDLLKASGPAGAALVQDAVTVTSIMYEIKRFTRT